MFVLQIASPEGVIARFPGGGLLEQAFIEACVKAIVAKGVGVLRTEAHVTQDIREGIAETIWALKSDSRYAALG